MGFWNSLKNGFTKVVGTIGKGLRNVGSFGQGVANTIMTYAKPVGDAVGGLVGTFSPALGAGIKAVGNTLNEFAPKASQLSAQVKGVGTIANKIVGGSGNNGGGGSGG